MIRLDHVVIATPSLDESMAQWRTAGVEFVHGGSHPGGTYNAVAAAAMPSPYLELIAAEDHAASADAVRVRNHHGPVAWAMAVSDIEGCRETLLADGWAAQPAELGGREPAAGGPALTWHTLQFGRMNLDPHLPFLIEWGPGRDFVTGEAPQVLAVRAEVPHPARLAGVLERLGMSLHQSDHAGQLSLSDGFARLDLAQGDRGIVCATLGRVARAGARTRIDNVDVDWVEVP